MTSIVHLKIYKGKVIQDCDVYIGKKMMRSGWNLQKSIWFNPFSERDFKNNLSLYQNYLEYRLYHEPEFMDQLLNLDGKILGCFCKGESCHAKILIMLINRFKN